MISITIGSDFSRTPGGRLISDGPASGQLFRDRVLAPKLRKAVEVDDKLVVYLDGPRGYLSSFLEEAFGGLIRQGYFSPEQIKRHLDIRVRDGFYEPYKKLAQKYIDEAETLSLAS